MSVNSPAELDETEVAGGAELQDVRAEMALLPSLVRQVETSDVDGAKAVGERVDRVLSLLVERVSRESEITEAMKGRRKIIVDLVNWMGRETKLWAVDGAPVVRDRIEADLECLSDSMTLYLDLESHHVRPASSAVSF